MFCCADVEGNTSFSADDRKKGAVSSRGGFCGTPSPPIISYRHRGGSLPDASEIGEKGSINLYIRRAKVGQSFLAPSRPVLDFYSCFLVTRATSWAPCADDEYRVHTVNKAPDLCRPC